MGLFKHASKNRTKPHIAVSLELSARRALLHAVDRTEHLQPETCIDRGWINREILDRNKPLREKEESLEIFVYAPVTI